MDDVTLLYILLLIAIDIIEGIFLRKIKRERRLTGEDIEVIREIINEELEKIRREIENE